MPIFSRFFLCLLLASLLVPAARAADPHPLPTARPKIALVLSGGGARGFAHIGVLRALRDLNVPIDIVVGTSMGAVIGGAFAAGRSVEELEERVRATRWDEVLADRPARQNLDFRRKEEDLLLPSRLEVAITRQGMQLPQAAASNAALEQALSNLLPDGMHDRPIDQLGLPFRSVASDLLTGEGVELSRTPLFQTLRASLAVPGVFAPVRIQERLVVDGGLVANLPVELARKMGAEIIIAVNVGTPLAKEGELNSAISVAQQMLQILTEQNVQRSIAQLGPQDILIAPVLSGISFVDFSEYARAMRAGEEAAQAWKTRLEALALSQQAYFSHEVARERYTRDDHGASQALPLASVSVRGTQYINPQALLEQSGLKPGEIFTESAIRAAASSLYGRGDLHSIETDIRTEDGSRHVVLNTTETHSSRNRLRFGLELSSDFSDNNTFSLGAMHIAQSLDGYGAELRTVARLGSAREFGTQFWQPLGTASSWYLAPSLEYGSTAGDLFNEGLRQWRVQIRSASATFAIGRLFGNWGKFEAGLSRRFGRYDVILPEPATLPGQRVYDTTRFLAFRLDTLDPIGFPTRGSLIDAELDQSSLKTIGEASLTTSKLIAATAFSNGPWAGHVYGEWSRALHGVAPSNLGGFLRLSGTSADALGGNKTVLARFVLARKIGSLPSTLGGAVRLGGSLEMGGVFGTGEPLRLGTLKQAGSVFLTLDSRFGPFYLGAGKTREGGSSAYLLLGPIW